MNSPKLTNAGLKNILVFRIGHLGDTLVALPAFWALRRAYPNAQLTLLTNVDHQNRQYLSPRDVLPEKGLFNAWLSYPTNLSKLGSFTAILKLAGEVRRRRFDAVAYLSPRERSPKQIARDRLFFRSAGVRHIIGLDYIRKNGLSSTVDDPGRTVVSEGRFLLDCLLDSGIPLPQRNLSELLISDEERASALSWLDKKTSSEVWPGRRLLAVAPGGKRTSRIWPEERFAAVVGRLIAEFDVFPLVFGGQEDRVRAERLVRSWGIGEIAAGQLSVRQSAALLETCDLFLGNDTGTMHLAAAVGLPCVAVYSAADWNGQWHPIGDNHSLLRKSVECEGCHLDVCPYSNKCLELIEVDEVFKACVAKLTATVSTAKIGKLRSGEYASS